MVMMMKRTIRFFGKAKAAGAVDTRSTAAAADDTSAVTLPSHRVQPLRREPLLDHLLVIKDLLSLDLLLPAADLIILLLSPFFDCPYADHTAFLRGQSTTPPLARYVQ